MRNIFFLSSDIKVIIGLFLYFILNILQSHFMELSFDESYYWIYSQYPSWGYFDHPPFVGWLIKLGTSIVRNEIGVRLFFNIFSMGSFWMLWLLTDRARPYLFLLLVGVFPLLQASGFLALPDTPLLFFSVLLWYFALKYQESEKAVHIFILPLIISSLFYSKYHGLLVVILTVLSMRSILKRKSFWIIVILTVIFYLPHMIWQYQHDFVSFKFHLMGRREKHFDIENILNFLLSQFLLCGIFIFPYWLSALEFKGQKSKLQKLLLFNTIPFFLLLFFVSFRNQIEGNWTITCSAALVLLYYQLFSKRNLSKGFIAGFIATPLIIIFLCRTVLILPYGLLKDADRLNEIKGWKERILPELKAHIDSKHKLVADNYQYAAKLSFYLNREIPAVHFGSRESEYSILNLEQKIARDAPITYISTKPLENSYKIEVGYKDPLYLTHFDSFELFLEAFGKTYEEIIRN